MKRFFWQPDQESLYDCICLTLHRDECRGLNATHLAGSSHY
uniref:Uncharacterized protein n=1 Tax=Anguilla anguilla TaxID=7936 RepID=A0A0E9Q605_ANGAN